jgi:hypothetical protein
MNKITTVEGLRNAIQKLEFKQNQELVLLKIQFHTTYDSLKPINILKNTFKEFTASPDFKDNFLGAATGLTAGYLTKALMASISHNPITKIVGSLLQLGITNVVSKNPDAIKSAAGFITNFLSKKKKENPENI